ncbi:MULTISPECIES: YueI family protein [Bacillus]|uniref:YueI family protein n=1 Tax=Bacillus TaxID=1386 RepID=UPI00203C1702|nr:YueI family protein [Bacillus safensis]MCM3139391.1 YueI family protein [Bacillus safensis]UXC31727.1 YueI family protein [Bacillus safensis]
MKEESVDFYLQQGIFGHAETKPDERRMFLGSLRERALLALTKGQVSRNKPYHEVEQILKTNRQATVLLNGELSYASYSQYVKMANAAGCSFKVVNHHEAHSPFGLVIEMPSAVNQEHIYLKDELFQKAFSHEFVE